MLKDWLTIFSLNEKLKIINNLNYVKRESESGKQIFPRYTNIFRCLHTLSPEQVKVIIIGQDPYHGPGQANGLSFAVDLGVSIPPSLKNIMEELSRDIGHFEVDRTLEHWVSQGVFLLNSTLTVEDGKPNSHEHLGWDRITNRIIKYLSDSQEHLAFILWGSHAQKKIKFINGTKHSVISSVHPSPLSAHRGFFGSKPFSSVNHYRTSLGLDPIRW